MPNPRKKIIMNEILFWKQNKLLPDHYCDFLMTLYSEGSEVELEEEISHKKSIKAQEKNKKLLLSLTAVLLSFVLMAILFYVSALIWLVAGAVAAIAIFMLIWAYRWSAKKNMLAPILHVSSALLIFSLCVKVWSEYFPENPLLLLGLLIMNCLLWVFTGFKFKLYYFIVSGIVGLIVLIGYQMIMV